MIGTLLRYVGRAQLILAALVLALVVCEPTARRYGDRLQIVLPMLAWGCAAANGAGREFFARFAGMLVVAHGTKRTLGEVPVNTRPSGGRHGFPSAHTSAAVMGASSLVYDCLKGNRGAMAAVVIAAAFVGASRIEARAHDIWQVLAGALLGWGADRALRRNRQIRERIGRGWDELCRLVGRGVLWLRRRMSPGVAALRGWGTAALCLMMVVAASTPDRTRAEVEISLYGGLQEAARSTVDATGVGSSRISWEGKSMAMPPYYGLRATWWRNETLGYGVEFNHAKVYAKDAAAHGYDALEFTDGLNLLTLNLWRRWPDAGWMGGRLIPYVGAGIGVAIPHVEVTPTGGAATFGYQVTGPAVQAVAGASWRMDDRWSLFGEAKASWSRHKADLDSGGQLETDITTGAINLGVSYRF